MTTPLGKYKLVKLIAAGGMAEVYLARQAGAAGFEKTVCLKRILPHLARDKSFVEMFLNEARLASQLDHPNIVSIFDLGEANGNYFIAMEFIDGPNLRSVAKRAAELGEHLPLSEVVKIVSQAAAGLQYAHDLTDKDGHPLGLVHRDISPDNVLVHRNGTAKVVDFGIAKAANSAGNTRTGTLKGKVAYMPPEQLRGEALDRRVDVFALGVVLYELLGGKRPWEADNEVALIGQIMTAEPQPLSELRPDAPPELVGVVHKALSKDRDERYQDCNELIADLEALLVQLGQSITSARVADFVRAYGPPKEELPSDGTEAGMGAVEEETFGTGAAAPILGHAPQGQGQGQANTEGDGTLMMPQGVPPPQGRGALYGVIALLVILLLGGGGAWVFLHREAPPDDTPVAVERAQVAPPPPAPTPVPVPVPEPAKVEPVVEKTPRKVAKAEPPPPAPVAPPVVVVREEPKPAPPPPPPPAVVTAKGELVIQVRPWAKIEVDGVEVGVTPLSSPVQVAAGSHRVRFVNSDLGRDFVKSVEVGPNERKVMKEILDE